MRHAGSRRERAAQDPLRSVESPSTRCGRSECTATCLRRRVDPGQSVKRGESRGDETVRLPFNTSTCTMHADRSRGRETNVLRLVLTMRRIKHEYVPCMRLVAGFPRKRVYCRTCGSRDAQLPDAVICCGMVRDDSNEMKRSMHRVERGRHARRRGGMILHPAGQIQTSTHSTTLPAWPASYKGQRTPALTFGGRLVRLHPPGPRYRSLY